VALFLSNLRSRIEIDTAALARQMSIGGLPMTRILIGALAAAALAGLAGTAQAAQPANVCQWTGVDWACGDGNVVEQHASAAAGPSMIVKPVPTVPSNEKPLLSGPHPQ
jgi:hypothetical protein